eukprot:gnl/TRDRNA2_/TRDRNA2_170577_c1_seq5.p1 gnl/TRDRNA2_/TRDRNA2_170577_c1~~gnl/TRDRNA2_/TRDRNA2_170577_c1_seq5.p1  ORF type:complete len:295 (-),score=47.93 gnl/TRDRNA2_/TRDRNA2_170577_c1_seq5:93-977(-)
MLYVKNTFLDVQDQQEPVLSRSKSDSDLSRTTSSGRSAVPVPTYGDGGHSGGRFIYPETPLGASEFLPQGESDHSSSQSRARKHDQSGSSGNTSTSNLNKDRSGKDVAGPSDMPSQSSQRWPPGEAPELGVAWRPAGETSDDEEDAKTTGQSQKHTKAPWSESKGSALHEEGQCTPCLWVRSKVGCKTGASCLFCHLEHRKQGRKRPVKSKRIRMKEQLSEMVDACDQNPEKLEQAVETVVAVDKNYMNAITKNKIEELKEQGRQQQQCEEVMNPVPQDRAPGCVSISGTKLKL